MAERYHKSFRNLKFYEQNRDFRAKEGMFSYLEFYSVFFQYNLNIKFC